MTEQCPVCDRLLLDLRHPAKPPLVIETRAAPDLDLLYSLGAP